MAPTPYLPAASSELNPTENTWQYLRQTLLSNRVFDNCKAVVEACSSAHNQLLAETHRIMSIATRTCAAIGQSP